ncbi:RIP metalloprotease RseP [Desulfoprunum benzoelyticum]|uniref:Zinc metalloprotease n=1 Tax=Desulfoprunum benzoelyticum TaxID=1506996 RepID=A0A840V3B2_9BACT|nr:RIP metalloprotease RseP [Desulfoprunum benzoelyticum]MBB5348350.1 regulator of sigma E protease [Desulfoprunum benzoelyticum]MBM9528790.1 RIP metalloprotease RseP [Desulfoprunum benzoelyticum]
MNTIASFILVLGVLIFVHELGHFIFAKLFGVRVLKFSLGFGPRLVGKVVGETEYVISAFPLGGFVKMFGENPDEQEISEADRRVSFSHKSVAARFCIVLAGPLFNLLFAVVLFFGLFIAIGVPQPVDTTLVGKVNEESPAYTAGLKTGDEILSIDGRSTVHWEDVLEGVKRSEGRQLTMVIRRGQEEITLSVVPQRDSVKNVFGEEVEQRYMIGIVKDDKVEYQRVGPVQAFIDACRQTWMYVWLTAMGFVKILQRVVPASELGGPILIAQIAGEQMKAGWINLVYFMGLLSVNLGILNLLPIPVLDGGHLVFLSIEGVLRRPVHERAQIIAQQVGIALLGALMIFVFYNDIIRILQ